MARRRQILTRLSQVLCKFSLNLSFRYDFAYCLQFLVRGRTSGLPPELASRLLPSVSHFLCGPIKSLIVSTAFATRSRMSASPVLPTGAGAGCCGLNQPQQELKSELLVEVPQALWSEPLVELPRQPPLLQMPQEPLQRLWSLPLSADSPRPFACTEGPVAPPPRLSIPASRRPHRPENSRLPAEPDTWK